MKKNYSKLITVVMALLMVMSMTANVFAYTAIDDDGARATVTPGTLDVVTTNSGMLRSANEGTTAVLSADKTKVDVTFTSTSSKTWGKVTAVALIEASATDAEKEEAAKAVTLDNPAYSADAVQKVFHYSIPIEEIGKKVPVCAKLYDAESDKYEWKTYNTQSYFIVLFTPDLYEQLKAAAATATGDVKTALEAQVNRAETEAEVTALELEKLNKVMMTVNKATLYKDGNTYKVELEIKGTSYTKAFPGYASEANTDDSGAYEIRNDGTNSFVTLPVKELDKPEVFAFKGSKYFNRTFTVSKTKFTYDNTNISLDQFDAMTEEEAIARASADTSVDTVNALIEAIQVQSRDDNTDKYCAIAHAYYAALSDSDKKKLEDPDYFGLDTGDATKDDPLNQDNIGEKELLVVSFGTSFNESRAEDIGKVEKALAEAYPDWSVRRAFTAQIIINHIQARDEIKIDNMTQALERAVANGVKTLVVQPTHLMHGEEYDELVRELAKYENKIASIKVAEPLLGKVGSDAATVNADKEAVAKAAVAETVAKSKYDTLEAMEADSTAIVFMGHGTSHGANITYAQMQAQMTVLGYKNVFIGTVEGKPESTALPEVKKAVEAAGYKKVILRPLMVVAGDHANNDMADEEHGSLSWFDGFAYGGEMEEVEGYEGPVNVGEGFGVENVSCQIEGLGRIAEIQALYVAHTKAVIETSPAVKKANTMKVTANTIKAKAAKKTTFKKAKAFTVKKAVGKVTFKKTKGDKKITISKAGKVTVKKGLKKGKTYKIKVKVTAAGNSQYKALTKTVTLTVKVK